MLKNFLSTLLCQRIRKGFPGMKETVENKLASETTYLEILGKRRTSFTSQQRYLVDITQKFQDLAKRSLNSPQNLPSPAMKLRGQVGALKDEFEKKIREKGHLYPFVDPGTEQDDEHPLYNEIRHQIQENRSGELPGMVNPAVLKPLQEKQASKWRDITKDYLKDLAKQTEKTSIHILRAAYKEEGGTKGAELEAVVNEFAKAARNRALDHLDNAWLRELNRVQTSNPIFLQNVRNAQENLFCIALAHYVGKQTAEAFMRKVIKDENSFEESRKVWDNWAVISVETSGILFEELHTRFERNTQYAIHDLLRACYDFALEDFINYVNKHIAEPFLHDPRGPVLGFSTEYVMNDLRDDEVTELGGEDEDAKKDRERTEAAIKRLEAAKRIAEQTLKKTHGLGDLDGEDY